MGQIYRIAQIAQKEGRDWAYDVGIATNVYSESFSMRFFVHDSLFRNVVKMLGNKEQQAQWLDDVENFRVYGCFAMVSFTFENDLTFCKRSF